MSILSINTDFAGQIGANPRRIKIVSTDDLTAVTTAGYLNNTNLQGFSVYPTDFVDMVYSYSNATNSGTNDVFTVSISNGVITLNQDVSEGNVVLPVVSGNIAVFSGTAGKIADPTGTAIHGGSLQAGKSGTAGSVISYPATATTGSLALTAVANSGNFAGVISNASLGQASTWTLADPGAATSKVLQAAGSLVSGNVLVASGTAGKVVDGAFAVKANTTAAYAGGGTSNAFTATGLTSSSIVTAVILASTNAVSIAKAVPSTNTLTVTFSADPGASTTVSWIAITPAV